MRFLYVYIQGKSFILALDEVDEIVKEGQLNLLYDFFTHRISLILISNVFDWIDEATTQEMRLASRASNNRLEFNEYHPDEVLSVMKFIVSKGLKKGVMEEVALKEISSLTRNQLMGDLRKGKTLISASTYEAMKDGAQTINVLHVERAMKRVGSITLTQILSRFNLMDRLVLGGLLRLFIINRFKRGRMTPTTENVYKQYLDLCGETKIVEKGIKPVKQIQMQNYLGRLRGSKIIDWETISYDDHRGRTNKYILLHPMRDLDIALMRNGVIAYRRDLANAQYFTDLDLDTIDGIIEARYG